MKITQRMTIFVAAGGPTPRPRNSVAKKWVPLSRAADDNAAGNGQDANGIDEGGFDGTLQLDVLFDVGRETLQDGVQNTAGLARLHHVYVQSVENLRRAAHRRG